MDVVLWTSKREIQALSAEKFTSYPKALRMSKEHLPYSKAKMSCGELLDGVADQAWSRTAYVAYGSRTQDNPLEGR